MCMQYDERKTNEKKTTTEKTKEKEKKKPYRNIEYSTNNCFECIESKNKLNKIVGKL